MSHVFISYNHEDSNYAHALADLIKKKGFSVWIDDHINYGDDWQQVIEQHIDTCAAFVVVMTEHSKKSKWVKRELIRADRKSKRIFALLCEGDIWLAVENVHLENLLEKEREFPTIEWYIQLAKVAPRTPLLTDEEFEAERQRRMEQKTILRQQEVEPPEGIYASIAQLAAYESPGTNDFQGIAALAITLEIEGSHKDAVRYLKRALKLEPRIRDKVWMRRFCGWSDPNLTAMEKILSDPEIDNRIIAGLGYDREDSPAYNRYRVDL